MCSASHVRLRGRTLQKVRVRVCICVRPPFGLSLSDCKFEEKSKTHLHYLIGVAAKSSPGLVFFLVFKTSAGTSDVVGYCDCRHVCDDEESHPEDLDEGDHVHEDHDDHCSASGTEDRLVMSSLVHCTTCLFFCLCGVAASSLVGLYHLTLVSVVSPFVKRSVVYPCFTLLLCQNSSMSDCVYPCSCMRIWYCNYSEWCPTIVA